MYLSVIFFFVKQNTAYEMRISDWSSDVCSSDLNGPSFDLLTDDRNSCIGCDVRNAGYHHIIVTLGQLLQFVRVSADGYDDKTGCDQLLRYHRADRARGTNNNGHFIIHCKAVSAIGIARQANALPTPKWEQRDR